MAQWLLGVQWGIVKPTVSSEMRLSELIVPGFVLGSASMAYIARLARTSIAENLRADYVRTAIAKGLPMRRVVGIHLLRNSLIPVVTLPRDRPRRPDGRRDRHRGHLQDQRDRPTGLPRDHHQGGRYRCRIVVVLVLVYLLMNLMVDLLYAVLDPRIRYE